MKTLSTIICLLLFATIQASTATFSHDLLGTWKGIEMTSHNGETVKWSVSTVIVRYQDHGFIIHSTAKSPGQAEERRILRCYDNGKIEGAFTKGGQTSGLVVGKWDITDRTFTVSLKVAALSGRFSEKTRTIMTNSRKTSSIITRSNGLRGLGTMRRK